MRPPNFSLSIFDRKKSKTRFKSMFELPDYLLKCNYASDSLFAGGSVWLCQRLFSFYPPPKFAHLLQQQQKTVKRAKAQKKKRRQGLLFLFFAFIVQSTEIRLPPLLQETKAWKKHFSNWKLMTVYYLLDNAKIVLKLREQMIKWCVRC